MSSQLLSDRRLRGLAYVWLAVVLALALYLLALCRGGGLALDTDILALLPKNQQDPLVQQAVEHMAAAGEQRLIVLIGSNDAATTIAAADRYVHALRDAPLDINYQVDSGQYRQLTAYYAKHRDRLLTALQRQQLQQLPPVTWAERAQQSVYAPVPSAGLPWSEDPFGLFNAWMLQQAQQQQVRVENGRLWLHAEGREWAVLMLQLHGSATSGAMQEAVLPHLQQAVAQAQSRNGVQVLQAGVLLHAGYASATAHTEMSTIGMGSTLGTIVLLLLLFRRPGPVLLAVLPIAAGTLVACATTLLVFPHVHVMTMVFGASLVGVAVDYSILYLCQALNDGLAPQTRIRALFPGLLMAMATTVVAYIGLALTPFPGLRQMAVFSVSGLCGAWLTTLAWLPWLTRPLEQGPRALWLGKLRRALPRQVRTVYGKLLLVLIATLLAVGCGHMRADDDIHILVNTDAQLLAQQIHIGRLLALPSPAQFYLVRGVTAEQVLRREEALLHQLDQQQAAGQLSNYQAVASYIPSLATQEQNRRLRAALYDEPSVLPTLAAQLGAGADWLTSLRRDQGALNIADWLRDPASQPMRHLWLSSGNGEIATVVSLSGVTREHLPQLAALAGNGVTWVDKPAEISATLARYRVMMSWVVALSYGVAWLLLLRRFGRAAWRIMAAPALASAITLAVFSWLGLPVQLFTVLALFLVFGIGADYGIYLMEQRRGDDHGAWLAVTLCACSTLLSFGLLALSQTPALHAFGLANLLGVGSCWLLAPILIPPEKTARSPT